MNLATIKSAIQTAVAQATELAPARVCWRNTVESGQWREWPCVDLVFRRPTMVGWDSNLRAFVPGPDMDNPDVGGKLTRTIAGPRTFVVEVRVEAENQDGGSESMQLVTRLQTRLQRPAIKAGLTAAGVNVATIGQGVDADFEADDRTVSLSVLELVFNGVENDTDTTELGDFATSLRFETTPDKLRDPNGEPAPRQVTVVVPPEED